jgi:hypothetical protein
LLYYYHYLPKYISVEHSIAASLIFISILVVRLGASPIQTRVSPLLCAPSMILKRYSEDLYQNIIFSIAICLLEGMIYEGVDVVSFIDITIYHDTGIPRFTLPSGSAILEYQAGLIWRRKLLRK